LPFSHTKAAGSGEGDRIGVVLVKGKSLEMLRRWTRAGHDNGPAGRESKIALTA
jgi:hypothetical protein